MERQSQDFAGARGCRCRPVSKSDNRVNRMLAGKFDNLLSGCCWVFKMQRQRLITPRIFKHVATISAVNNLQAELLRCIGKGARLIASLGCQQKKALGWKILDHTLRYRARSLLHSRGASTGHAKTAGLGARLLCHT